MDLQIDWADRVAITGPNGAGKSTLLAALLGRLPLDSGAASLGPGVVVGEIDQARGQLFRGSGETSRWTPSGPPSRTRHPPTCAPCSPFGLKAGHVLRPAGTLRPGAHRAALALLQGRGVNLLVLDEPTNHLDLPAIEQLESALASYPGTLLLVTHDRRMLTAVHTTRRIEVDGGRITDRSV
ncbi:ATP-binding cassette domain-containing protein [Streptomyces albulus]|nr:ATP-binding cassette domain-containing protein [Streptomyces noursei]